MVEKVSTKIIRLEKELADEVAHSLELQEMIRHQAHTIDAFANYFVKTGLAKSRACAIEMSRSLNDKNQIEEQLSFDF